MTVSPESVTQGAEKKPQGSLLIFEANSLEEVKQIIERDIYFTEKVVCPLLLLTQQFIDLLIT